MSFFFFSLGLTHKINLKKIKKSQKNDILKGLGATLIRTPSGASFDSPNSHFGEAQQIKDRLNEKNPGCAHVLDQYTNPYNPIEHYDNTAQGRSHNKIFIKLL